MKVLGKCTSKKKVMYFHNTVKLLSFVQDMLPEII